MIKFLKKILRFGKRSLRLSMLSVVLLGIGVGVLLFVAIKFTSNAYINNVYMSEESCLEREESYLEELQDYIDSKKLTSENQTELLRWAQGNRDLFFMIYTIDNQLVFESDPNEPAVPDNNVVGGDGVSDSEGSVDGDAENSGTEDEVGSGDNAEGENENDDEDDEQFPGIITLQKPTREEKIAYAERNGAKHITMSDGDIMMVYMADFSEYSYYDMATIAALVAALIVLVLIVMFYFHRLTRRIIKLGGEVNTVASHDMSHHIKEDGEDEIGRLSENVENMRLSMLKTLQSEREAMDANTELITAMSHDIRTPLTVLLGYLDVMKLNSPDGNMREYIDASEKTALRLKKMSDDMFNYFLVFGGEGTEVSLQEYDGATLIDQLLAEHILLMREQGYDLRCNFEEELFESFGEARILTDAQNVMRIVENLFSNMMKYADKQAPVSILVRQEECKVSLTFENRIDKNIEKRESSGIGLKTCGKISEMIGADFEITQTEDKFSVNLKLKKAVETK